MDKNILYDVFRREMRDRKIPISLGKTCPVKCTFCYEKDNSYRPTLDVPLTTQEDWEFILREIQKYPTHKDEAWLLGGNEYMEWTDLFLHPAHPVTSHMSRQKTFQYVREDNLICLR